MIAGQPACDAARDLAALYVLGALDAGTDHVVRDHLATCDQPHPEFADLGGVAVLLAETVDPVEPSSGLRERILTAASSARAARPLEEDHTRAHPVPRQTAIFAPAAPMQPHGRRWRDVRALVAIAAVVVVVVVGGALVRWSVSSQNDATAARARSAALASVVGQIASGAPVVHLASTAAAPGASGVAVIARTGVGYLVISGLPPAPAGRIYEAWFISRGSPRPAGLFDIEADGLGILAGMPAGGRVDAVAVTQEPVGGSSRPTGAVLAAGTAVAAHSP